MLVRSGVQIDDADREELRALAAPPGAVQVGCLAAVLGVVPVGVVVAGVVLVAGGGWLLNAWGMARGGVSILAWVAVGVGVAVLAWVVAFARWARRGAAMALQPDADAVAALQHGTISACEIKAEAAWLVEQGICDDDLRTTVVRVAAGRFVVLPQPPGFEMLSEGTWRSKPTRTIDAHSEIRWMQYADGTLQWLRQVPLPGSVPLRLRPGLPRVDDELLDALHAMGERPREVGLEELPEAWRAVLAEL